jgi:hypothetical protein
MRADFTLFDEYEFTHASELPSQCSLWHYACSMHCLRGCEGLIVCWSGFG